MRLVLVFALLSAAGFAAQEIELKSGASVVVKKLAEDTTVSCEASGTPLLKCACGAEWVPAYTEVLGGTTTLHSGHFEYRLYYLPEKEKVALDVFSSRDACHKAQEQSEECK